MKESLKPKAVSELPDDLILQKMAMPFKQESKTVGKHRLNLSLPVGLFDELRAKSNGEGLTVTAYLITLINAAVRKD